MTAAQLRSLLTVGSVLPCSPVRFVDLAGVEYELVGVRPRCGRIGVREGSGSPICEETPTITLRLRPLQYDAAAESEPAPTPQTPSEDERCQSIGEAK